VIACRVFVFVFVYLPTDLSVTDNFHKFQLKIRLQTSRKQKTKAVNYDKKKTLNCVENWCKEIGLSVNAEKTTMVLFTNNRKIIGGFFIILEFKY
jgi:hypothetical protein